MILTNHIFFRLKRKFLFIKKNYSFYLNNILSNLFHGKIKINYYKFQIPLNDIKKLKKIIKNSGQLNFLNKNNRKFNHYKRKIFQNNKSDYVAYKHMSLYTTWHDVKTSTFLKNFLTKLSNNIKKEINSPFSIVNFRAWKSKPNSKATLHQGRKRGAFRMHKDGMPPGHLKCMIYLNPLNNEHGKFQIRNKIFENKTSGLAILFKNSDVKHQAITGKKYFRFVIEVTIMRTFKEVDELKYYPSSPNSLYLNNAFYAYL